jgi:hypothetical protein
MSDRLAWTGLTRAEAEQRLDWLENHGYSGCHAELHGDVWTVLAGETASLERRFAAAQRVSGPTTHLPAAGS